MLSSAIRQRYLDFFAQHGHTIVSSSSLIPQNDPTLLFTNAGMVQFKDAFLGAEKRPYTRAVSSQCCVRAGGKHNDLENVGYTARHHTFFEMLGNFSFGDYFKREAIQFAWKFLTEELKLPKEKLWVTVFEEDDEAADIWIKEIGVDPNRLSRIGAKDNFWAMGDTGPCGPCSEIFYDHGADIWGGPPGSPEEDGDRYIEIWNLVFMQYNRLADGTLQPLPKPSVDTGMGLERVAAVMQHVHNNYETDLFMPIIRHAAEMVKMTDLHNQSLRVIADHLRASTFLITDGVRPSNEGRGYVLRRIMRRAMRHGYKLGMPESFFYQLLPSLINVMGDAYPHLKQRAQEITHVMKIEEEQFSKTLALGMKLLEQAFVDASASQLLSGEVIFKLYDTYGFPFDLTADIARERQFQLDEEGFHREMTKQREMSKAASRFGDYSAALSLTDESIFKGYEHLQHPAKAISLYQGNEALAKFLPGDEGTVILDQTPFYAESGGQVGDQGYLKSATGVFRVTNTQKAGQAIAHIGVMESGELMVGAGVDAQVDEQSRQATALNHSATHLLHSALQKVLGEHVEQKGSLVSPERLRFDFAHTESLSADQIREVENLVNAQIRANNPIVTKLMSPKDAVAAGAKALFGEKYGDEVRVLSMGEFSKELCGGTHATFTGEIGLFKIMEEASIASGIRRIEALTGEGALQFVQENEALLKDAAQLIKANRENILEKLQASLQTQKQLEKQIEQMQSAVAAQQAQALFEARETNPVLLIQEVPHVDAKQLRLIAEALKPRFTEGGFLLASQSADGRVNFVAAVSQAFSKKCKAGDWVNVAAKRLGGKGGGRPDFAQAGGTDASHLKQALQDARDYFMTNCG